MSDLLILPDSKALGRVVVMGVKVPYSVPGAPL